MNYTLLKLTHNNLTDWLARCSEETISNDRKLQIIMQSIADICMALGTDGTLESAEKWSNED